MHDKNFCHRDLKPENLLFMQDYSLQLTDFGFATNIRSKEGAKIFHGSQLGTPFYMAPEINANLPYQGDKVDIYSAGVVLFILLY